MMRNFNHFRKNEHPKSNINKLGDKTVDRKTNWETIAVTEAAKMWPCIQKGAVKTERQEQNHGTIGPDRELRRDDKRGRKEL